MGLLLWCGLAFPGFVQAAGDRAQRYGLVALVVGLAAFCARPGAARRVATVLEKPPRWAFLLACSLIAAGVSLWLVRGPLRSRVLAIDSAVYVLQARALSHFSFGVPIPSPAQAFGGRFLFEGSDGRLHGVFPPGYPLFLAPFVRAGMHMLAGPVTAALLVPAQYALARVLFRSEFCARACVLLALPSFARAIETADLLSHAFVAACLAGGAACALECVARPKAWLAVASGVLLGWATCARLLDGVVLGALALGPLGLAVVRRRAPARMVAWVLLGALPFAVLLMADQRAATGSALRPTQLEYFARSDYPAGCHRLGFGRDVGCIVEHPHERASFGRDGYTVDDAARVARTRAGALGRDLLGLSPLLLLAFAAVLARGAGAREVYAAAVVLALTLAYGLFYYGNAPLYGARHLFPAAPFAYALVARAIDTLHARGDGAGRAAFWDAAHARGAGLIALLCAGVVAQGQNFRADGDLARRFQSLRVSVPEFRARYGITRGIVAANDSLATVEAMDPWSGGNELFTVLRYGRYLSELRAMRPGLPIEVVSPPPLGRITLNLRPPPVGFQIEAESAWPSFLRTQGAGATMALSASCCAVNASDGQVLFVFAAQPGAEITIPFEVAREGVYAPRVDAVASPRNGDWEFRIDGVAFPTLPGYSPTPTMRSTAPVPARRFARGRHTLVARCVGKDPRSAGYLAAFDAIIGTAPASE